MIIINIILERKILVYFIYHYSIYCKVQR